MMKTLSCISKWLRAIPALLGAATVLLAVGVFATPQAQAQISGTKHNLGSEGTKTNKFDGTGEICVFCHTPHGSNTTAAVPLWNRTMTAATEYTTYNSLGTSSLDGATAPVGSVSLACLSCHDGTQAMNVMLNTPGSGIAAGGIQAGAWNAEISDGKIGASAITNIGKDLKNDHPVGIQYAGGPKTSVPAAGGAYDNTMFNDADFKPAQSDVLNGQSVWWVDTGTTGLTTREKTDMQLYTRTDSGSLKVNGTAGATLTGAQPFVECASCHDPHSSNTTFLRIENTGSAVCLACHTK